MRHIDVRLAERKQRYTRADAGDVSMEECTMLIQLDDGGAIVNFTAIVRDATESSGCWMADMRMLIQHAW